MELVSLKARWNHAKHGGAVSWYWLELSRTPGGPYPLRYEFPNTCTEWTLPQGLLRAGTWYAVLKAVNASGASEASNETCFMVPE